MDKPECVLFELCEAIADEHLIQASEKSWVKVWIQSPIKYRILYERVEPFIINLPTSIKMVFDFISFICKTAKKFALERQ